MRILSSLLFSILTAGGLFWAWINFPEARNMVLNMFNSGKFQTLEVRYTSDAIMENNKQELLLDEEHSFLEPKLHFLPYLLMEVKYNRSHDKTGEGILLWSLVDGEMVINTRTWETTHGFTDCIAANADREDFKVINALAAHGGAMDRESLSRYLNVENNMLDKWLDKCKIKSLIVQTGNAFRLHMQNPKMQVIPETKLNQWLVSKTAKNATRLAKRFRSSQIEGIACSAFGHDFTVRKTKEIFLPVYSIVIQNPDGSQMTTFWNALNGKKLPAAFHLE